MKNKYVVNENFQDLSTFIESLPNETYVAQKTFCNNRNKVVLVETNGHKLVVKKFHKPTDANMLIYTFLRKPKSQRAYEHAQRLLNNGIETPRPIGYATVSHNGIFQYDYYVCEYIDRPTLRSLLESDATEEEKQLMRNDFVDMLVNMHSKRIFMKDNNPSNFLAKKEDGHYKFAVVDINRMEFGKKPNRKRGMRAFSQTGLPLNVTAEMVEAYCQKMNMDQERGMIYLLLDKKRYRVGKHITRWAKNIWNGKKNLSLNTSL